MIDNESLRQTALTRVSEIALDAQRLRETIKVSRSQLILDGKWVMEEVGEALLFNMTAHLYGQEIGAYHHRTPSTWWQAFKKQHFPAWALRRFPVQYSFLTLRASALFPDYAPPHPLRDRSYVRYIEPLEFIP